MSSTKPPPAATVNPGPANSVHVRCGSDILERLKEAGLPGHAIEWSDPVSQGPLPPDDDPEGFAAARARFLASDYRLNEAKVYETLVASDSALDAALETAGEIVLWFEHDLYDQAVLVRLLDRIGERAAGRVSIVTLDDHPSVERFIGLGQLSAAALAALYSERKAVARGTADAAREVWQGMLSADPRVLADAIEGDLPGLPFLRTAMRRFLADFPGIDDGLAETEHLILRAVADGAGTPGRIFGCLQDAEPAPWMGDLMLWPWILRLAEAEEPALAFERPVDDGPFDRRFARQPLSLTAFGERLLDGTAHWLETNGTERWVGAVEPKRVADWRWDGRTMRLVQGQ